MKEHFCPAEQSIITYQGKCNWCGESERSMTQEALKLALEALEKNTKHLPADFDYHFEAITAITEALAQTQEPVAHWSDCAVHSEPAYPKGECDCGGIVAVADYTALSDKYVALSDKYVALKAQRTEQLKTCVYCGQLVAKEKT